MKMSTTNDPNQEAGEEKKDNEEKQSPGDDDESIIEQQCKAPEQKLKHKTGKPSTSSKRGAAVNFQDTCELYEIDLESGTRKKESIKLKPPAFKSVRYYVMILALVSPFVTTYSRTIINFAIIDMIDYEKIESQVEAQQVEANKTTDALYFDRDNSCPVDDDLRAQLVAENKQDKQRAISGKGEKYPWGPFKQGILKGSYAFGHMWFQIPGSRLSEMYGSHKILSASSLLIAVCCLGAPYLAALSFYLLVSDLILLGILGSFMSPALITLFSNWLTPSEKSLMMSFYLVASRLGSSFSSLLCGLLIETRFGESSSWRYVFFSAGWISLVYSTIFYLLASSTPKDHPLSSQLELDYLATKNTLVRESLSDGERPKQDQSELEVVGSEAKVSKEGKSNKVTSKRSAPWKEIATSAPVWAFIITKFCVKFAGDTIQIELPGYLKSVMHFSAKDNGFVNSYIYVIFCVSCLFAGFLARFAVKRQPFGFGKTTIRKIFQCSASFSVSLAIFGIAFSVCNRGFTLFWLFMMFFATSFSIGGEAQIPLDISERYSGTIHAIGSSSAISGFIEPLIVGFLIRDHAADRFVWKRVWLGASAISLIGGLVFLIFADATIQPFDSIRKESSSEKQSEQNLDGKDNKAYVKDDEAVDIEERDTPAQENGKPYRESIQI